MSDDPDFHFVCPPPEALGLTENDLASLSFDSLSDETRQLVSRHGEWVWSLRTQLELKRAGRTIPIGPRPDPTRINISHGLTLRRLQRLRLLDDNRLRLVSCDADKPRFLSAVAAVQQSPSRRGYFVPHWPERGLIARDPSRRQKVTRAGYFGIVREREKPLHAAMATGLARHGIEYEVHGPNDWLDYSTTDIVIGLRSDWKSRGNRKPASKLYNAVLAGAPFIGTPEPSYIHFDPSMTLWLPAASPREAVKQATLLSADSARYRAFQERCSETTERDLTAQAVSRWNASLDKMKRDFHSVSKHPSLVWSMSSQGTRLSQQVYDRIDTRLLSFLSRREVTKMLRRRVG